MIILGDIGNTETKICLVNGNYKIIKKILLPSKGQKITKLNRYFKGFEFSKVNNSVMMVGPVSYNILKHSFLENFQLLDFLSLQAATLGGFGIKKPFLCNGANLAYKKTVFTKLNGFQGNENIASGDDIFLFEKF